MSKSNHRAAKQKEMDTTKNGKGERVTPFWGRWGFWAPSNSKTNISSWKRPRPTRCLRIVRKTGIGSLNKFGTPKVWANGGGRGGETAAKTHVRREKEKKDTGTEKRTLHGL